MSEITSYKIWKRMRHGLPARRVSFILQAASDTPTSSQSSLLENSSWSKVPSLWQHQLNHSSF